MAKTILQHGKALAGVVVLLVAVVAITLCIWCKAQASEVIEAHVDPNEAVGSSVMQRELVDQRGPNRRVWEVVRAIPVTDSINKDVVWEEQPSRIVEVGTGICYADEAGDWQITDTSWYATGSGFVIDKAPYSLSVGPTADNTARF